MPEASFMALFGFYHFFSNL